jgi:hypothetical protein
MSLIYTYKGIQNADELLAVEDVLGNSNTWSHSPSKKWRFGVADRQKLGGILLAPV